MGCQALLQRIFPTQEPNPGLLHCRQILYIWARVYTYLFKTLLLTISIFNINSDIKLLNHMVILLLPWQFSWLRIPLQCKRPGFDPWGGKISWRRPWQPTLVFLPGESPWAEEPGGLQSMGSQRVRHDWATKHSTWYFCLICWRTTTHFATVFDTPTNSAQRLQFLHISNTWFFLSFFLY